MISNQQVEELVRRASNSIRWTRGLRRGLLYALLYGLFTNLFTNDALGNGILIAVCVIWVGLSIQARRKANLTTAASQMIAAGQLSEAREMLSRVCRGLCIHKPVLLMACHNLAVILQKEKQWLPAWQFCELVRNWARKSNNEIRILSEAVRRMLPKNKLGTKMLAKLKLYVGDQHPHQAQDPEPVELAVKS